MFFSKLGYFGEEIGCRTGRADQMRHEARSALRVKAVYGWGIDSLFRISDSDAVEQCGAASPLSISDGVSDPNKPALGSWVVESLVAHRA